MSFPGDRVSLVHVFSGGVGYPSGNKVSRGRVYGGVGYLGDIQRVWVSRGDRVSPKTTKRAVCIKRECFIV